MFDIIRSLISIVSDIEEMSKNIKCIHECKTVYKSKIIFNVTNLFIHINVMFNWENDFNAIKMYFSIKVF